MGGGASSQAAFEQMIACTMILGDAMVQGLDPRYVRFPDMYRLYDFHVGPKKHQQRNFHNGQMVLFVQPSGDINDSDDDGSDIGSGGGQPLQLFGNDGNAIIKAITNGEDADEDTGPMESNDEFLVVYVAGDKIVLDKATLHQPNNDGWTPLHACCHTLNAQEAGISIVKELVARHGVSSLNSTTRRGPGSFSNGWTPLHIAVAYGLEALALKLIRAGADVNTSTSVKWTPLYDACHRGYATLVREMLKAGARHDGICPEYALCPYPGQYPLAEAARQGAVDTVKLLLEWGVDKNAANNLGWTALHEASYHNRVDVVKLLVVYGADVLIKTVKGSLAKDVTISGEIRDMLEDLTKEATAAASPKRMTGASGSEPGMADARGDQAKASSSPKKSPSKPSDPLSRKEDYELLGDLPNLSAPSISIRDVGAKDVDEDEDHEQAGGDDKETPTSPSQSKHKSKSHKKKNRPKKLHGDPVDVPSEFKCAVSRKLLREPLRSPYGQVFEKQVLAAWFRDFGNRCPLTGQPLSMAELTPDDKLKSDIRAWRRGSETVDKEATKTSARENDTTQAKPAQTTTPDEDDPYDF